MRLNQSISFATRMDLPRNPRYSRVDAPSAANPVLTQGTSPLLRQAPPVHATPGPSRFLVCPMPGVTVSPDSLRQFHDRGVPQMRVIPPSPL